MRGLVRLLLIVGTGIAVSCGTDDRPLNVVLIGLDTVRYDHLGCYGYERATSPNADRLAGDGVLFENVVSQAPWTLPSFATILTSLYPDQHGANAVRTSLGTTFPTLGELLRENGYATGAIINAAYLKPRFQVDRGFDFYAQPTGRVATGTTAEALTWIDQNRDSPFFMFVHYFDPHLPYSPPVPYDTIFDPDYTGHLGRSFDLTRFPDAKTTDFEAMRTLEPADWDHIRALYDGEIAFTDEAVGDLLKGLKERGLTKNTLIVFLSDHGEEFFEHGGFEHGHTLYNELLRVPLIFSLPGRLPRGVRIGRQVRLVDIAPTIMDLLGLESRAHFEGVSLKPLLTGEGGTAANSGALLPPEIAYAEATVYGTYQKSVTAYPWKLIYNMTSGETIFFNLAEDPGEHNDISDVPNQSLSLLQTTFFRTLINISEMWFVEMVGGDKEHVFDLDITCGVTRCGAYFSLHKLITADGALENTEVIEKPEAREATITIGNLKVEDPVTLAVRLSRWDAPIRFDLKIDGRAAVDRTFIGGSLTSPAAMPFSLDDSPDDDAAEVRPTRRPEPPYFLVWLAKPTYGGDTSIELDAETERELRSLGYIQ
jgi:arylsulfatase A-like enzyme